MRQFNDAFEVETSGKGLHPITEQVRSFLRAAGARQGLATLFIPHTSASLLIQENADPDVLGDLERFFSRLVKDGARLFAHNAEGPDDMPAHIRAALTQTHLGIPIVDGQLVLGIWQGIYLYEHRTAPHRRRVLLHFVGI